jgi:hypothetical protein
VNSVNWAGEATSTAVLFKLTWDMPGGAPPKDSAVMIPIGSPGVQTGHEVARELVDLWKAAHKGGPHVISKGSSDHFMIAVSKVELSANTGATWVEIKPDRKIYIVPGAGNEGLCAWRS